MLKKFLIIFILINIVFTIYANLVSYIYIFPVSDENSETSSNISYFIPDSENLFWPTPGYYNITSGFGDRINPITKKASFHHGIDIGAKEGSIIYSACSGTVSYTGYSGANGYSIHISYKDLIFIYGHVSPNYIVKKRRYCFFRTNNWICWSKICNRFKTELIQMVLQLDLIYTSVLKKTAKMPSIH